MISRRPYSLLPLLGLAGFGFHGVNVSAPPRDLCPATCIESGLEPSNWTVVAEFGQLQACKRPLVLDFSVNIPVTSVEHLQSYLENNHRAENRIILFATVSDTTVGVYVGANLLNSSVAESFFGPFLDALYGVGIADSKSALIQLCEGRTGDQIFGLIVAASSDFAIVHKAVGQWFNGTCVDTSSYAETLQLNSTTIATVKPTVGPTSVGSKTTVSTAPSASNLTARGRLQARADCRAIAVKSKLPDIRPKKNADGSCFAYQIKGGDFCAKIAVSNGLTVKELENLNKNTWGWNGCENGFRPDNWICLSEGTLPFLALIANAVCGPQKPGTVKPRGSESKDWAKLNPCTAKKDTYGCISNCGMSIIQSFRPFQFIKLGYFEGFNMGRECLNMDASQIDPSYTYIHFAFGMIDNNFNIYQENKLAEFQFQMFKKLRGPKRIISFGGWVFSAEAPNYPIFRSGVKAQNRHKLADNLVKCVIDNGLDGLDLDWEYPSAPDLPDIPPGDLSEAIDYLRLLALLRAKLPRDKSLSIAAPASFWYLKQFPIKVMSELLDDIVYMTYDLHGQWDAGNKWASPSCPTGNYLRSHINRTETIGALTMITKAGIPSNKVLVGVSSYGRSFQMADPSCTGPNCLFTGDRHTSYARKGRCTDTGGYLSNTEIDEIKGRTWTDAESNSKIMVDGDLWVSYMDDNLKETRTQLYKRYNMGGTIDWAVDLVKSNILLGESVTCSRGKRTGDWVSKQCTMDEVAVESRYTPKQRWAALECQAAWDDTVRVWFGCYAGGGSGYSFSQAVAEFLHQPSVSACHDLSH
ncbi:hypothetical protein DL762_002911 [Monosporascus cannonballus]|uniref:chitinase n=1 Tax=Monosporascus cannonballus TaxID=155416 RepID=A0ABY0HC34_9PEZI|nr:hypothetical protein DL762_002911 [Monosporascus cannonballus]